MKNRTPLQSVKCYCRWCARGLFKHIVNCPSYDCDLFMFRLGKRVKGQSVLKVIRKKCLDCAGGVKKVRFCEFKNCPLHNYRFGSNPRRKGVVGDLKNLLRGRACASQEKRG